MASKRRPFVLLLLAFFALGTWAKAESNPAQWLDVEFARDSPVLPIAFSLRPSTARVIGTSTALDLHASLLLRNTSSKAINGLTLKIEAQDLAPAGKASLTVPSLRMQPGDVFPLRIDLELRRPFTAAATQGPVVQVSLDCVLFKDLSTYGPDKLNSRRTLTIYELQARREREYVAGLLAAGHMAEIREELNFGLQDQHPPAVGMELSQASVAAESHQQTVDLDTMNFADAPVTPVRGNVKIAGGDLTSPHVDLKNTSQKLVRSIEVGWIVRDEQGKEYLAGSMPAVMQLKPIETGTMTEGSTLHLFRSAGQPVAIGSLTAFVSDVEFADGGHWIPSRADILGATKSIALRRALFNSPEQQRLADIYRRKGIGGLTAELKRTD